ncbi:MAG TPA: sugar ABC transporter ATP-binding protein [Pyrinomonadaceae bacterium]|nr:sugar ABC transporter ATP-binding protein [Pyrinomonadaceae bacterium]
MNRTILQFEGIGKSFYGVPVLTDIGFAVPENRVLGLVGENGAGKSTLMNILGGIVAADAGRMTLAGEVYAPQSPTDATRNRIAFIHQELNLFINLSIAENIFVAGFPRRRVAGLSLIDRRALRDATARLMQIVGLEHPPETLVERLSQGERQLVEIAKALSVDARLIIFDEPTTSLTAREVERLFELIERLRSEGKSLIYISHALSDVLRLCDDVVILRDGRVAGKGTRDEFTLDRMISLMVGRKLNQLFPARQTEPTDDVALKVSSLTQPGVLHKIDFTLHKGEVLGLAGLMGSGRSELARMVFGLDSFVEGEITVGGKSMNRASPRESVRRGLAFLTENRREEGLLMEASIADNIALVSLPQYAQTGSSLIKQLELKSAVNGVAESVHVSSRALHQGAVKNLSGGNQQKVVLAKWILNNPAVFILDEPTRGIDVGAKYEVYRLINRMVEEGAGVLFISSEIEELMGMCDRILVMSRGEIKASYEPPDFDREQILRAAFGETE